MKVKEVVLAAARMLGLEEGVAAYFEEGTETLAREAKLLLECFNRVEQGLALDYLPLYAEEEFLMATDEVEYSALTYSPVRILAVTDGAGVGVKYKLYPKYLKAQSGKLKIAYTYTPTTKGIEEDSDYTLRAADCMFTHGVLTEYCLAEGRLDESLFWDKKYKEELKAAFRSQKCRRLRARRWI